MTSNDQRASNLIETIVRLTSMLGLNGTRVRWKLLHWQKRLQDWRQRTRRGIHHVGYRHAICPQCGQVQDRHERQCVNCSAALGARTWQIVNRLGLVVPTAVSVSTLLGMVIAIAYLRLLMARPGSGYFSVASDDLIYLGAYYLPALQAGQLWRHATAVFLHIGLVHLAFNMLALAQIGPAIEDVFGRGRMLFLFMLTGIAGFAACQAIGMVAVSAGASGAIMGLTGAAAGWGQRDGTSVGRNVRTQMLKWAAYTMIFGVLVHANNIAHAAGFLSGAILGFLMPPRWLQRGLLRGSDVAIGALAMAALAIAFALVLRPPDSSEVWAKSHAAAVRGSHLPYTPAEPPPTAEPE
ncbi:MAG TPA: rhomboid family intramembrane serine protease [Polyangia bacterium]